MSGAFCRGAQWPPNQTTTQRKRLWFGEEEQGSGARDGRQAVPRQSELCSDEVGAAVPSGPSRIRRGAVRTPPPTI